VTPARTGRGSTTRIGVIGIGNRYRRDDAAGLEVASRLSRSARASTRIVESEGEPTGLISEWDGLDHALVIDAVRSSAPAGTVHRFEAAEAPLPATVFGVSTHAMGMVEAVELARALDRLPRRLTVYGIEGRDFGAGVGLSPGVERAVVALVKELAGKLRHPARGIEGSGT
jgi:hydrogenase maturation protease